MILGRECATSVCLGGRNAVRVSKCSLLLARKWVRNFKEVKSAFQDIVLNHLDWVSARNVCVVSNSECVGSIGVKHALERTATFELVKLCSFLLRSVKRISVLCCRDIQNRNAEKRGNTAWRNVRMRPYLSTLLPSPHTYVYASSKILNNEPSLCVARYISVTSSIQRPVRVFSA